MLFLPCVTSSRNGEAGNGMSKGSKPLSLEDVFPELIGDLQ